VSDKTGGMMTKNQKEKFEEIKNNFWKFCEVATPNGFKPLNQISLDFLKNADEMYKKGYELKIVLLRKRGSSLAWIKKPVSVEVLAGADE